MNQHHLRSHMALLRARVTEQVTQQVTAQARDIQKEQAIRSLRVCHIHRVYLKAIQVPKVHLTVQEHLAVHHMAHHIHQEKVIVRVPETVFH